MRKADADALAKQWLEGKISPEDFDDRITQWKTEAAVRDMIKHGDIDQRQFVDEVRRRSQVATPHGQLEQFKDKYPWRGAQFTQNPMYLQDDEPESDHETVELLLPASLSPTGGTGSFGTGSGSTFAVKTALRPRTPSAGGKADRKSRKTTKS